MPVQIFNNRGDFLAKAVVTDRTRSGVVSAPSIWWNKLVPGGRNANSTTSEEVTDMGGGATFYDNLVEVRVADCLGICRSSRLIQSVHRQAGKYFRIKIGGLLRHDVTFIGDVAHLVEPCRIEQKRNLRFSSPHHCYGLIAARERR